MNYSINVPLILIVREVIFYAGKHRTIWGQKSLGPLEKPL